MSSTATELAHWHTREPSSFEPGRHPGQGTPGSSAVHVAQLQGMVMALYGVSASDAISQLRRHSSAHHTCLAHLADEIMASISERGTPVTTEVLGTLLAGTSEPGPGRVVDADPRWPSPAQPRASVLRLAVAEPHRPGPATTDGSTWQHAGLSRREAQALRLIAEGMSNQDIAATMFVTVNTVKSYVRTAYQKTRVTTRAQAVRWALLHDPAHRQRES